MECPAWLIVNSQDEVNRRLEELLDSKVVAATRDGVAATAFTIQPDTSVWVRTFIPTTPAPAHLQLPVFFYFHGGGFVAMSANSAFPDSFCRYLCKTFQAIVVSVDYRKAPDYRYPTAYDDCYAAVQWLATGSAAAAAAAGQGEAPLQEADLSRCFLVGESAGGNIVHHVACRLASHAAMKGRLTVLGNLVLAPFFGGEERTPAELRLMKVDPFLDYDKCDACWRKFLPAGANRDHPAVNVSGPEAPDLRGLPLAPFLVTVGEYDSTKDWQLRYVKSLQRMGHHVHLHFYKGGIHCFHCLPDLALSSVFRADLEHFVHSKLLPTTTTTSF
ncbi:hypothetical protein GOP47_0010962 [Adiantum capillus-veneris]|uniref:Alpha/beta hydrolase fold-3 domain-containing protein n=1 Tax=Adiantum capillus-veneris TaxID=13818 RepID=A0A9D4UW41_ADICA|nr:hypothetical protein GOP47_0010962 [Adiantum capillus-veneris]